MSHKFFSALVVGGFMAVATATASAFQATSQQPADSTLKDRISYRLDTDPLTRKYDVKVKVDNGIASLTGTVATAAQKSAAGKDANVTGVKKVENDVVVDTKADVAVAERTKSGMSKTGEKITDAWITTKVKWFYLGDDGLKGSDINVDTNNNVVTLKGTVISTASRNRAVSLAQNTEGVHRVVDELKVVGGNTAIKK